ncbi:MAG: BrnA antitoxin family protein [Brevundimonas sp.]|uniref:BrnA antitoxin family protein n=1 Tax=Brevundimonas sp. TaxID=1871086 RepID=UPI002726CA60|nr:BrnA antitoxin family protein [Brevundimonas sp.]MDO9077000.1 BrnA antitoxin family protein [Brevundimonas sp.]
MDKDDAPELTREMMKKAGRGRDVLPEAVLAQFRRGPGRPPADNPKVPVSIRLDKDVVDHFRATGEGWQTRINSILRDATSGGPASPNPKDLALRRRT